MSQATNLLGDGNDFNNRNDVLLRDLVNNTTRPVSDPRCVASYNHPCGQSGTPSISADGRYVAFASTDGSLVQGDSNGVQDIFRADMSTDPPTYQRVSMGLGGVQPNGMSETPSISADGRYVVFLSTASNLVSNDNNNVEDVFIRDTQSPGTTMRVSMQGPTEANGYSDGVPGCTCVTADGNLVVFMSSATNLAGMADTNGSRDVFVHNVATGETTAVDVTTSGALGIYGASYPSITPDGSSVVFSSSSPGLVQGVTGSLFQDYVRNRSLTPNKTSLVSMDSSGNQGNGNSADYPQIAANGQFVAFSSTATNLVSGDTNASMDVFAHDSSTGATDRLSVSTSGAQAAGGPSRWPSVSRDARYVGFQANVHGLVDPYPGYLQIYVRYSPNPSADFLSQLGAGDLQDAIFAAQFRSEPVNTAIGNFYTSASDASLPGIGVPFAFTRSYNSADQTNGPFGPGWTHRYNMSLAIKWNGDAILRTADGQQLHFTKLTNASYLSDPGVRDGLVRNQDGTYTVTRQDQVTYGFDAQGRLASVRDRNGQGPTFSYTAGNLTTITDSVGRAITLSYNGDNRLTQLVLPDGRSVSYGYTGGHLTSVTDLRGYVTTYAYDAAGRLTKITDPNGHDLVQNAYGGDGRVVQQTDAMGNLGTFSWDPQAQTSIFTDARGKVWKDVYANNVLMKRIDPLGNTTRYEYDSDLNPIRVTDPLGHVSSATFDGSGNVLTQTDPLNNTTTYTYDAKNNVKTVTDPNGNVTTFDYDSRGNLIKTTRPGGNITNYSRDPTTGLLTSVTDPRGKTTSYGYDGQGNLTSVTDPLSRVTTMGYDGAGRMTSKTTPRLNAWNYAYDAADHPLSVTDPLGDTSSLGYDPAGNITSRTDANNHTTSFGYDADNRLSSVTPPGTPAAPTAYAYDAAGNLISRTDPNNHTTASAYDDAGRLTSVTDPSGRTWAYAYFADGQLRTRTYPSGGVTTYSYDNAGQLSGISYSDPTPAVSFTYYPNGLRHTMTDGAGTISYVYDTLDRLASVTRGTEAFSYGYDPNGNVTSRTYPDGTVVTYGYDDVNELTSLAMGGNSTTYGYNLDGNVSSETLPNGVSVSLTWDAAGRLTDIANSKGGDSIFRDTYTTLDGVGNPLAETRAAENITYQYDARDRLTRVCYVPSCSGGTGLAGISYEYDGVGNRMSETRYGPTTTTTAYSYDAADQLASSTGPSGTTSYTYRDGNVTQAGPNTFAYDLENRLTSATVGGTTYGYTYDGDGNRLTRTSGGSTEVSYKWDLNAALPQLAMEKDGAGGLLRRYVYGKGPGEGLVSMTAGGAEHYFLGDVLGSVVNLTDATGAKEWTYAYEPYGAIRSSTMDSPSAPTNLMRFTGELFDPRTSIYGLRARDYDPALGRFFQEDPVKASPVTPYVAEYVYSEDRPLVLIDPSGAEAEYAVGLWDILHEAIFHFPSSFKAGAEYLRERSITLNIVGCIGFVCFQVGTNGVYIGAFGVGRGPGPAPIRYGWGASVYASFGKPQSTGGSIMVCRGICGGSYVNAGGGGGVQVGVGTPGVFVGGQFPWPHF